MPYYDITLSTIAAMYNVTDVKTPQTTGFCFIFTQQEFVYWKRYLNMKTSLMGWEVNYKAVFTGS